MTGIQVDVETQAQRIAARGREALVERMRNAYGDAAAAHADLVSLDDERIEAMVQAAVDRADGLQWRRALARVASDELGLSVPEALNHPAVTRAQELVGAPSYEQSLAELIARPIPLPVSDGEPWRPAGGIVAEAPNAAASSEAVEPLEALEAVEPSESAEPLEPLEAVERVESVEAVEAPGETPEQASEPVSDRLETVEADDVVLELLPEPDPIQDETQAYDVEATFRREPLPPVPVNPFPAAEGDATAPVATVEPEGDAAGPVQGDATDTVATVESEGDAAVEPAEPATPVTEATFPAIHLGGVANLPTKRDGLSVRLSAEGLDILHGPNEIIGRLVWDEIETLEVPNLRVRRRHRQPRARLVVRTPHGDASFEVPDLWSDELRDWIEPLIARYGRH